ncbi:hypothetical protein F5884DRAFT_194453 [Xylogone sp. PMI_703]|nr:hypothetical protein F5884DRAFT_194453 [Xylogone sp. PMI_703]
MSAIPVYTSSPISASKATGVTPQTKSPMTQTQEPGTMHDAGAVTTSLPSAPAYPTARPGASAPAPTGTGALTHRNEPLHPTPTTKIQEDAAPPQPGAVPVPPYRHGSNLPPPPKVGETYHPPAAKSPSQPPQMAIPPPMTAFQAQHATMSSSINQQSKPYPISLPVSDSGAAAPRRSLEHPPGYQQNVYASELTNSQRIATEAMNNSDFDRRQGYENDEGSLWDAAKKWAQTAGTKLSQAEEEVWRRINKE